MALLSPENTADMRGISADIMSLFPDRVIPEPNSGCWLWTGAISSSGYGTFGRSSKTITAHRFSLQITYGQLGRNEMALHKCDTKLCVNPAHLYSGTKSENSRDAYSRGRMIHIFHPAGEDHPSAILTSDKISEIRSIKGRFRRGQRQALAERFGVSPATISDVKSGRSWRQTCS